MERSGERETVTEFDVFEAALPVDHADALANIPDACFLKHALADEVAKLVTQSVESALGGVRLVSAVLEGHAVLVDHCDEVSIQAHQNLIVLSVEVNRGVVLAPTLARSECSVDGGQHFGFDLTHLEWCSFDSYSMALFRGIWGNFVPVLGVAQRRLTFYARRAKTTRPEHIPRAFNEVKRTLICFRDTLKTLGSCFGVSLTIKSGNIFINVFLIVFYLFLGVLLSISA